MTMTATSRRRSEPLHSMDFRLSYGECDPAGIVYYATYYSWFERVNSEWAYLAGFPSARMPELWGVQQVARASHCEYLVPGQLHDLLTCDMHLGRFGRTSYEMCFTVRGDNAATYATGSIAFVFVTLARPPKPTPVPEGYRSGLKALGCDP